MTLLELAERCEKATGPDVDLDLDISEATGGWKALATWKGVSYTASLDAAMTLVPDGQNFNLFWRAEEGAGFAGVDGSSTKAATPALALCAAALRARAAQ
jgi:hypothetical protein